VADANDEHSPEVWVLDTHTKGTGANMVPLKRVLKRGSDSVPGFALPQRRRPRPSPPQARRPYRFKVVDVMTGRALADDVDARGAIDVLSSVRSIVDVTVYVWDVVAGRWRRLTFGEASALWKQRTLPD
jgi:hypothetical protein